MQTLLIGFWLLLLLSFHRSRHADWLARLTAFKKPFPCRSSPNPGPDNDGDESERCSHWRSL